jgi:hypothetical protein
VRHRLPARTRFIAPATYASRGGVPFDGTLTVIVVKIDGNGKT